MLGFSGLVYLTKFLPQFLTRRFNNVTVTGGLPVATVWKTGLLMRPEHSKTKAKTETRECETEIETETETKKTVMRPRPKTTRPRPRPVQSSQLHVKVTNWYVLYFLLHTWGWMMNRIWFLHLRGSVSKMFNDNN